MKILFEGDTGQALCERCQALVAMHYTRRDVPFSDGLGVARDILVGVCDGCDTVVAIPPQSTPAIREARKQQLKSIEARLPAVYLDVLDAAMQAVSSEAGAHLRKLFLAHYFHWLVQARQGAGLQPGHEAFVQALDAQRRQRGLPASGATRRLSMKVNAHMAEDFLTLLGQTRMSQTELLKAVIARIQMDVLEVRDPQVIEALQRLTRVAG
ncbi:hypothetical protein EON09_09065 [Pseudomonas soli]|uniref:Uncharacterized protein n=1 Tax=Pseudomonas soli TaxID=1306993 RepID=A0AAJ5SSF4_9PSED|nr:hypothetical protein [Pseudomonas soli]NBK38676.1 hypothetical protein [Pseudomonas soli]UXZ44633.1 hypothetical protein K7K07_21580 [Pseudomonas soli]WJO23898.1 hypothetical protein LU688_10090 [Pseudomonas soli]